MTGSSTSVTGNITGGNILTGGLISVTGNVQAGNIRTAGLVSATGAVTAASVVGGVMTGSSVSVTGNVSGVNHFGTNTSVTGTTTAASVVGGVITGSSTSVTGTTTAASVVGGVITGSSTSVTGNVTGNYLKGNASQVTGVNTFSQIFVTGATTVNAASLASNVTFAGGSNIALTSDGATITIAYTSVASTSIFATGGDMGLIANPVTESEDLGTVIVVADTSYDLGDLFTTVTYNQIDMTGFTSNINTGNLNAVGLANIVGNINGGNIKTVGLISATGNVTGGNLIGTLANGTSNISVTSSSNIVATVAGAWAGTFASGVILANTFWANNNGGGTNFRIGDDAWIGDVNVADTISIRGQANVANGYIVFGNADTTAKLGRAGSGPLTYVGAFSASGNITGGNVLTAGLISATGNITGGNILITAALSVGGNITSRAVLETATITATAPAAPTNFDIITQAVQYYTANANANVTLNFRGNATTTANVLLATGQSTTIALLWTNGATAYYPNVIQVDGANVTPKWQGGTAVSGGNPSAIDVYAFTIIKTAATPTYVVLGSQTKFS
jgi:hypothetical protein